MNKKLAAASLAVLALAGGSFSVQAADTPVYSLDAIVVTANRTPEKQLDSNASVSVVTAQEIEQKHFTDVAQAVKNVPGVFINTHGAGSQSYNSDQIYINGSSNVVVLVDGMRRNTNGNSLMNASIGELVNMDSIDHIEVLKGSASTLYGSDAQGGVINIITKKAKENGVRTTLRTSFGDNDKEKYTLYNEGKEGQVFWTVEAGKELQGDYKDGWGRKVINHLNAEHYNVKLGYDLGNDSNVVLNYEKYKSDYLMPIYGSTDKRTPQKSKKNDDSLSLQYQAKLSDRMSNQFSIYRNKTSFNVPDQSWDMKMKTTGIADQLTYTMDKQTLIGGFEWYQDEIPYYHDNSESGISNTQGKSVHNIAFYLQDKIDITEQWNITPGVRVDHHSQFGTHTSPSLSVGFKKSEKTNFYINYKSFFVAPNMYQLYAGKIRENDPFYGPFEYQIGNRNLKPQEGNTIEFGVNHEFDDTLSGTFNVFHTHAKNIIVYGYNGYENTGKTNISGFNINLSKEFGPHWTTSVGYSYLFSPTRKDVPGNNININNNGQLPESTLNINVGYQTDRFNANLSGRGIMNRYGAYNYPEMRNYGNYWVWDLAANYQFTKEATLFARVNNIFDQFYTDVGTSYGPNANPASYQSWYSAPGRNFEVGLQFQF